MMKTLLMVLIMFGFGMIGAQAIVLNPMNPLPPCSPVPLAQTLEFDRGINCDVDVILLDSDMNEVFRTSDQSFSITFDQPGEFTFFCGAGPSAVAMAAICVEVDLIPTLSEWSVICLGLILMIIGTIKIKDQTKLGVPIYTD